MPGRTDPFFVAGTDSEHRELVLSTDWSSSPLGPPNGWPDTLRTAATTVLNCPFPMLVMWGPDLVMVYNAAYAPVLGDKHPAALGQRCEDVWAELWPTLRGRLHAVLDGAATYDVDLPLVMHRHGYDEDTWFTFSYSPVLEPDGRVGGVLNTTTDTTGRVLGARRLTVLQRLSAAGSGRHGDVDLAATEALSAVATAQEDCPFGVLYLLDADRSGARAAAAVGLSGPAAAAAATPLPASDDDWVWQALVTDTVTVRRGLADVARGVVLPEAGERSEVETVVALPLTVPGQTTPMGVLVLGTNPQLPLDAEYRTFLQLVAAQVAAVVADAQAYAVERRRAIELAEAERAAARFSTEVSETLQRSILGPVELPPGFAVRYEPATSALEVGGDWYDVVELADGVFGVVVGDVVGRGLAAAAVMGQLRSAGRALLLEANGPAQVLSALDRFAGLVRGATCSTVFCAVVDRRTGVVRYSSAGHLPALVVDGDAAPRLLLDAQALPLAVLPDRVRPEAETTLAPGASLLLYTDGLVERRDEALDEGIARALGVLDAGRALHPELLAGVLVDQLLGGAHDDDVALMLYRQPALVPVPVPDPGPDAVAAPG
ncbi:hypothetical protein ASG36_10565 [Geodermatophilus sp. Leaf369]|uniref:SpoIIE family protein phosphatase n=1 Tax=Geodermatophilus sp. Leaf369 TaxID=1736354 RepID=UPI0006FD74AD|nr:SpoIIE family protein phosphatase [Geodermatophilus sp. Leaf369]KQS58498.1 hypothetical protein ASG36_10565 [Geodermatophilus sp. Leaf369]